MARLKVEEINARVNQGQTPNLSAVKIPLSLATVQSAGFGSVGAAVEKIYKDQKDQEDNNEFFEITKDLNPKILESFSKYKKFTNSKSALEGFSNDIAYSNFKELGSNNAVKKKLQKYLNKTNQEYSLKLLGEVYDNSITLAKSNDKKELDGLVQTLGSGDNAAIPFAKRDFENYFTRRDKLQLHGPEGLAKLKEDKLLEIKELQYINAAKNRQINLFDANTRAALNNELNEDIAKSVIEYARNADLSDTIKKLDDEKFREKKDLAQKVVNFTSFLTSYNDYLINRSDETYSKKPSIDDLYDAKQAGALSSAQFNTLIKFYNTAIPQSDEFVEEIVNAQLSIAETVEDLDQIQNDINLNEKFASKLSPEGIIKYNKILDKYKEDTEFSRNHKFFTKQLKNVTGYVNETLQMISLPGMSNQDEEKRQNQMKATTLLNEYNSLVLDRDFSPEDAYAQVIKRLQSEQLPRLQDMAQPSGVAINYEQGLQDDPTKFFEKLRTDAANGYNLNTKDISLYISDLEKIDRLEDVFKARVSIIKSKDEAFK
jgi:hypothetical protein